MILETIFAGIPTRSRSFTLLKTSKTFHLFEDIATFDIRILRRATGFREYGEVPAAIRGVVKLRINGILSNYIETKNVQLFRLEWKWRYAPRENEIRNRFNFATSFGTLIFNTYFVAKKFYHEQLVLLWIEFTLSYVWNFNYTNCEFRTVSSTLSYFKGKCSI